MNIAQEAYKEMLQKEHDDIDIEYSGRYKPYNARITMRGGRVRIKAAKEWKTVSRDIQKGLIQELLVKLYNNKMHTINMDLYSNFIRSLPRYVEKKHNDPELEQSFNRINENHFKSTMDKPNLRWGKGTTQLGRYEYASDTVTISRALAEREQLLDYVMYHELLHKKYQFTAHAGKHRHHTTEFRKAERAYPNADSLEKEIRTVSNKFTTKKWAFIDKFIKGGIHKKTEK